MLKPWVGPSVTSMRPAQPALALRCKAVTLCTADQAGQTPHAPASMQNGRHGKGQKGQGTVRVPDCMMLQPNEQQQRMNKLKSRLAGGHRLRMRVVHSGVQVKPSGCIDKKYTDAR